MAFDALVKRQIQLAFSTAGDLAKDLVLHRKTVTGFNFGTNAPTSTTAADLTIKVLPGKKERVDLKNDRNPNTVFLTVIAMVTSVDDLTIYDTATLNGVNWSVSHPVSNDGYILTITLTRVA